MFSFNIYYDRNILFLNIQSDIERKQMKPEKFETNLKIPINYIHLNSGKNKPLVILFHGFADSAKSFLKRAFMEIPTEVEILAINGPFPLPQKKDGRWKHAYAWYFVDLETKEVYIHPDVAVTAVNDLLHHLGLQSREKIVIGFSQGGFFVPFLLHKLKQVKQIFTIGCGYRPGDYPEGKVFKLDALHGEKDEIVTFKYAKDGFDHLKNHIDGSFTSIASMGHNFNDEAREWLKNKITEAR